MKIIIQYDTDNETATDSIISMLETILPYMVDNIQIGEDNGKN